MEPKDRLIAHARIRSEDYESAKETDPRAVADFERYAESRRKKS